MARRASDTYDNMEAALRRAHKEGRLEITGMTYGDAVRLKNAFSSYMNSQRVAIKSKFSPEDRKVTAKEIIALRADLLIVVERIKPQDGGRVTIYLRDCAPINQALRRALAVPPGADRAPSRNEIMRALEEELNAKKEEEHAPKLR